MMALHFSMSDPSDEQRKALNDAHDAVLLATAGDSNDTEIEALNDFISELMAYALITDDGETRAETCDSCGEATLELNERELCPACAADDDRVQCPNCGDLVEPDEMNHWPNLAEPVSMCDSCEHNARRSGWEPGQ